MSTSYPSSRSVPAASTAAPWYLRYGLAVLTTAIAVGLTLVASDYFSRTIFLLVFVAVSISAWYGGLGPGLTAALLGMLVVQYLIIPPRGSLTALDSRDLVPVGLFILVAGMMSAFSASLRAARARAELGEAEAKALAQQLQNQTVELEQQVEETQMLNEELEEQTDTAHRLTSELEDANRRLQARSREQLAEAQRMARLGSWEWRIGDSRVAWSDEMYRVYGLEPGAEEITYERYMTLIHPEDRELAQRTVTEALARNEPFAMEHRIVRPDGTVRLVSGRGKIVGDADGTPVLMVGTGQDITEQREMELAARRALAEEAARQAAERAGERTAALQRVTAALSSALTPKEVSDVVLRQGMAALGATGGGVALLTSSGTEMELVSLFGFDDSTARPWSRFSIDQPYPVNDVVSKRELVFMESIDEWRARYPELAPAIAAGSFEAYCAAPLEIEERVLGTISYNFPERRSFSEEERAFLRALAGQAAQALERSRLFEAERHARAQAEAANTAKMQFLTMMSHELRTPLNAIAGYSELLVLGVHGPVTDQQREDLERIQRSQKHLLGLINDILNFAKVETGHVHLELTDVPVNGALQSVEQLVSPQLRAKQLDYRFEPAAEDLLVRADREKMLQVVLNLLSNAMKFTPAGGRITLHADRRDRVVSIRIRDTGIGIPSDKLELIFDPFVQVSGSYTRTVEGTGLGLAISRDLARAMGGEIVVESELGNGSTFTLTLPRGTTERDSALGARHSAGEMEIRSPPPRPEPR